MTNAHITAGLSVQDTSTPEPSTTTAYLTAGLSASELPFTGYNLYTGKGVLGEVDFDTVVALYPSGAAAGDYVGLDPEASSTYTLVLRPEIEGLETPDVSCSVELTTDGAGEWVGLRPDPVASLKAEAQAGGVIRVSWYHRVIDGATPDDFQISYGTTSAATGTTVLVTADGSRRYTEDIALSDGVTYWFSVTARDSGVESARRTIGGVTADSTAPAQPSVEFSTTWRTLQ